jgi:Zn-dependent protease
MVSRSRVTRARLRVGWLAGVPISLHWSWIPCLLLSVLWGRPRYSSVAWTLVEIVGVFLVVLLHEFGHVLVARRFGRTAREVILSPLGGLAVIDLPKRPWHELLVAAAGPAVNLLLAPILFLLWYEFGYYRGGDVSLLLWSIAWANVYILVFNLLPIWPLDGGRVLQSAISSRIGLTRGRFAGGVISIACAAAGLAWSAHWHDFVTGAFLSGLIFVSVVLVRCSVRMLAAERAWGFHESATCPHCASRALDAPTARCEQCGEDCNLLRHRGRCWNCHAARERVACRYCFEMSEIAQWYAGESP